ncbi:unnamed protein product [Thlaspi arvense]|uniref:F-box domain-containing protein n=1 Tax=Thlaspi arvense TaxID=13288 RepID=A0AAU9T259_THLAR|nr:unnamed protein product [Thlaspi arvense]
MEMEKMQNPNSHERLESWSDHPLVLLNSVLERLSFANFQRAKSVCTSWHFVSRQCVPKSKQIHWLILFPEDNDNNSNNNYSCRLFNPEEKDKLYKTQDLGLEFARSDCIATYGSWLLMRDSLCNLYILNLFTLERINLPPTESQTGMITKLERTLDGWFRVTSHNGKKDRGFSMRYPVLWIDEKTKDYVVLWGLGDLCVVYSKKGDTSWNQIPDTSGCRNVIYKDSKLYILSLFYDSALIFDFSGEIPQRKFIRFLPLETGKYGILLDSLVVTVTGDVLTVRKIWRRRSSTWSFRIYKDCSSGFEKKYELIHSLGDESMCSPMTLMGSLETLSISVLKILYLLSNHVSSNHEDNTNGVFFFNLETWETEPLHKFDSSPVQLSSAQWFLPSCTHT